MGSNRPCYRVEDQRSLASYGGSAFGGNVRNSFLTSTPTIIFSDPNGDNMIQFALTPEIILGDVNGDLVVNFLDIAPFIQALAAAGFVEAADVKTIK